MVSKVKVRKRFLEDREITSGVVFHQKVHDLIVVYESLKGSLLLVLDSYKTEAVVIHRL